MTSTEITIGYLRDQHPEHAELARWVRAILLETAPELSERIYRGWKAVGFHHPEAGYVCGIFPRPQALLLTFEHGWALPDTDGLLIGNGTQVRSLPVDKPDPQTRTVIQRLLEDAIVYGSIRRAGALPPVASAASPR